jgi:putative heme-binding domain-containing protein
MSLAGTKPGAESFLDAVAQGKASPRLLQDKPVLDRLRGSKPDRLDERVAQLTKGMATADQALQKLIDQRAAAFKKAQSNPAAADPQRGHLVFLKNCVVCHQIAGEGAKIGPQLDGIGKRGADRIAEDILDPSRNVDLAFRYSVIRLKSGDVLSGLQRREEGQTIVFADSQGKEFTVPKDQIDRQTLSQLSLMPGNFADLIPPEEFNHLMAFLLSK